MENVCFEDLTVTRGVDGAKALLYERAWRIAARRSNRRAMAKVLGD